MKLWKKIAISIGVVLIMGVACVICWSYGFSSGLKAGGITLEMADFVDINLNMRDQFENADCDGVKRAINDFLLILERHKDGKGFLVTKTAYLADKMLSHVRLARIEKQLGNYDEEKRHMQSAREACDLRKWKDCSDEKMIWIAKRFEKNVPITCLRGKEQTKARPNGAANVEEGQAKSDGATSKPATRPPRRQPAP